MKGSSKFLIKGVFLILTLLIIGISVNRLFSLNVATFEESEEQKLNNKAINTLEVLTGSKNCLAYDEIGKIEGREGELATHRILDIKKLDDFKTKYSDLEPSCARDYKVGYKIDIEVSKDLDKLKEYVFSGGILWSDGDRGIDVDEDFFIPFKYEDTAPFLSNVNEQSSNGFFTQGIDTLNNIGDCHGESSSIVTKDGSWNTIMTDANSGKVTAAYTEDSSIVGKGAFIATGQDISCGVNDPVAGRGCSPQDCFKFYKTDSIEEWMNKARRLCSNPTACAERGLTYTDYEDITFSMNVIKYVAQKRGTSTVKVGYVMDVIDPHDTDCLWAMMIERCANEGCPSVKYADKTYSQTGTVNVGPIGINVDSDWVYIGQTTLNDLKKFDLLLFNTHGTVLSPISLESLFYQNPDAEKEIWSFGQEQSSKKDALRNQITSRYPVVIKKDESRYYPAIMQMTMTDGELEELSGKIDEACERDTDIQHEIFLHYPVYYLGTDRVRFQVGSTWGYTCVSLNTYDGTTIIDTNPNVVGGSERTIIWEWEGTPQKPGTYDIKFSGEKDGSTCLGIPATIKCEGTSSYTIEQNLEVKMNSEQTNLNPSEPTCEPITIKVIKSPSNDKKLCMYFDDGTTSCRKLSCKKDVQFTDAKAPGNYIFNIRNVDGKIIVKQ
ncbi:MAG: hypothetical protein J4428_02705 [Candidatus Aenigmarchaeota archaeon]|nr:hypothetical protein [Candidatus Aenigmarchaeota archaeon]